MTNDESYSATGGVERCPSCSNCGFSVVGKAPGLRCTLSDREFEQPDYEIRKCAHCFILYRTPNLSANELSAYYSLVDYRKWEIPGIFPTERAVRQKLLKLREGARVLDFGCSSGRLLAPLVGRLDCYGFEINAESARAAAEKGLKMISQNAIDSGSCRMFDAIVLCDVFEHLSSPTSLLARLVEMLEPAGTLIVVTGNADSSACIPDPANFWYFRTVEHLCMMNRKHAEFIEQELKLKLTDWITLSHYDSSLYERAFQWVRHVAYWEFRGRTFFGRRILPIVPYLRRARQWKTPPIYTASDDHVVAVFEKL